MTQVLETTNLDNNQMFCNIRKAIKISEFYFIAVTETMLGGYQTLFPLLPGHRAGLYFPAPLAVRWVHAIGMWAEELCTTFNPGP